MLGTKLVNTDANEPRFNPTKRTDTEMQKAYALASTSINIFIDRVKVGREPTYMAKLRFRDPGLSEKMNEDQFLFLWLNNIIYHQKEKSLSGTFFEVPQSLQKWHQVGQRLEFDSEDVFDWMINNNGKVEGGFTIRVTRSQLSSKKEKIEYDEYIGISSYEPIPEN